MTRAPGILLATLLALAPLQAARAAPCTLAPRPEPCDAAPAVTTAAAAADRAPAPASPWLDDGPPPAWMAPAPDGHRDHRLRSMLVLGGLYVSLSTWMYFAWYHDQPRLSGFVVGGDGYFGEDKYAGGLDKVGHAWANLVVTRGGAELLRWGGWRRRSAAWISAGLSSALFLFVEIKDGYYYQLSPGDLIANTAGALLGAAMTESPALDDLIDLRVSYWPSAEYRSILDGTFIGDERINSVNVAEDYSGQTYFLAVHLAAVPRPAATPRWLSLALDHVDLGVGFRATGYKPDPPPTEPPDRRQELFLGATLDLQRIVDRALAGRRHRAARWTRTIGHGVLEVLSPPFAIVPVVGASRSPDD